jgi:hypothetical protein
VRRRSPTCHGVTAASHSLQRSREDPLLAPTVGRDVDSVPPVITWLGDDPGPCRPGAFARYARPPGSRARGEFDVRDRARHRKYAMLPRPEHLVGDRRRHRPSRTTCRGWASRPSSLPRTESDSAASKTHHGRAAIAAADPLQHNFSPIDPQPASPEVRTGQGSDRGSPNAGSALVSKWVIPQIPSPVRVRTSRPVAWRMPPLGARR